MLTSAINPGYASGADAKSSARFGDRQTYGAPAPHRDTGAFFVPGHRVYGGWVWEPFGVAGFRVVPVRQPASSHLHLFGDSGCGSNEKHGVSPMTASIRLSNLITRSLKGRAAAHRAMAKSALFADSSASVRLRKYNSHIEKAQQLEARALEADKCSTGGLA